MPEQPSRKPARSRTPLYLAVSTVLVVVAAAAWGLVVRALQHRSDVPAGPQPFDPLVGLVPAAIATLSTLTIVAWVSERRRVRRRRRILRRLNTSMGAAASVYVDIDLLEAGSPLARPASRDVFDALELEAQQILEEGEMLRGVALRAAWREPRVLRDALEQATASVEFSSRALVRKAKAAASTGAAGILAGPTHPDAFAEQWESTARAIWDELERALSVLIPPDPGVRTPPMGSSASAHARIRLAQREVGAALTTPTLGAAAGTPAGDQSPTPEGVLAQRRESARLALSRLSGALRQRLEHVKRPENEPTAVSEAAALASEQLDALPAPWWLAPAPVITPDAFAAVADPVLDDERERRFLPAPRRRISPDEVLLGGVALVFSGAIGPLLLLTLVIGVPALGLGAFLSGTLLSVAPELRSGAWLPWLGPLSGLLLALVPWCITGLVFLLGRGGAVARTDSRRRAEAALAASTAALRTVVARWDDTLLALAAAHPGPGNAELFARKEAALHAAQLAALRTVDALDSTPAAEREEEGFLAESLALREDLEVLTARQHRILEGPNDAGAPPRL